MTSSPQLLIQQTYVVPVHRGGSVFRCALHGCELSGDARYMGVNCWVSAIQGEECKHHVKYGEVMWNTVGSC